MKYYFYSIIIKNTFTDPLLNERKYDFVMIEKKCVEGYLDFKNTSRRVGM